MRVMVLGAGGPAADNYIKSLRLADPQVYTLGVDTHPLMLELSSATETVVVETTPAGGAWTHFADLAGIVCDYEITMVHAQPDEEAQFLSYVQHAINDYWGVHLLSVPEFDVVKACRDKLRCANLLGDLAPKSAQYDVRSTFTFPAWMRAKTGAGSLAATLVSDAKGADAWQDCWFRRLDIEDFMLSEYLPGEDRSYTGVWWRGEPVASACRVRVEYADTRTPSGQCSSPRIAKLDSRPETFDTAEVAIRRVSEATGTVPHGVFYVDMRESADGRLLVTEINAGRFNTTQNFYAEAGLNLPMIHAKMHHENTGTGFRNFRLRPSDDREQFWVRQPDMGHKLVTNTRVTA